MFPPGSRNLAVISGASAPIGCTISPPWATTATPPGCGLIGAAPFPFYGVSVKVLLNVPEPSLVVTPFSKKQPPPNDRPTVCTLWIATWNASMTSGLSSLNLPFQSDHMCMALTGWLMVIAPWESVTSGTLMGFDHQNCV